jgi:hypothetical protein
MALLEGSAVVFGQRALFFLKCWICTVSHKQKNLYVRYIGSNITGLLCSLDASIVQTIPPGTCSFPSSTTLDWSIPSCMWGVDVLSGSISGLLSSLKLHCPFFLNLTIALGKERGISGI